MVKSTLVEGNENSLSQGQRLNPLPRFFDSHLVSSQQVEIIEDGIESRNHQQHQNGSKRSE